MKGLLFPNGRNYSVAIRTQIPLGLGSLIPILAKLGLEKKKVGGGILTVE
jgi:hypothetical protein